MEKNNIIFPLNNIDSQKERSLLYCITSQDLSIDSPTVHLSKGILIDEYYG